ncbi:MAG TPA: condensation domain-containing protein, partial [Terriglobales bacterium]|nr:condensation domain-containing protein [Terriglobales bacterium]
MNQTVPSEADTVMAAPLSPGQEQLWFLAQLAPDLPVYNEQVVLRRRGAVDAGALERALDELVRRHPALRTTFVARDGQPEQVVGAPGPVVLQTVDLSHLPLKQRQAEATRLATEDVLRPFDLERGPLWRARLLRLGPEDQRLSIALHHLVFDGFSLFRILAPELTACHAAYAAGQDPALAEPRLTYAEFASWQNERTESPEVRAQLEFWRRRLAGLPALDLPADHPRLPVQSFRGAVHRTALPRPLCDALHRVAAAEGATFFMVLLAAFAGVLRHYTGQDDLAVGTLSSSRKRPEHDDVFGYLLNPLVVRVALEGDPEFRVLLSAVRESLLEAVANDDIPFEHVVGGLGGARDPGRNPLFQVLFTLEPALGAVVPGWTLHQNEVDDGTSKFDLSVELDERADGMIGRWTYRTDLFEAATIARMADAWQRVLGAVAAAPATTVGRLPVLGESERHRVLVEWNGTGMEYERGECVHEAIEAQVERTPEAEALVVGDRRL